MSSSHGCKAAMRLKLRKLGARTTALVVLMASICATTVSSQSRPVLGGPKKRIYAAATWDLERGRMLLIEGQLSPNMVPVSSWSWDPKARAWESMAGLGTPSPTCAVAWDSAAKRVITFVSTRWLGAPSGNLANVVENVSETWAYDSAADSWSRIATTGTPTAGLLGARMAYDTKAGKMVLHGGLVVHGPDSGWKNETWTLDLARSTWTLMKPAASPPPRNYHAMAYDEASGKVIIFGSDYGDNDPHTWAYDTSKDAWERIDTNPMPVSLVYADMVYLPDLGACLLFGGAGDPNEKPRGDTWLFTMKEGWTQLRPAHAPTPRAWHAMAWDPVGKRAWLYGGGTKRNTATSELWYWDLKDKDWHMVERDATTLES